MRALSPQTATQVTLSAGSSGCALTESKPVKKQPAVGHSTNREIWGTWGNARRSFHQFAFWVGAVPRSMYIHTAQPRNQASQIQVPTRHDQLTVRDVKIADIEGGSSSRSWPLCRCNIIDLLWHSRACMSKLVWLAMSDSNGLACESQGPGTTTDRPKDGRPLGQRDK